MEGRGRRKSREWIEGGWIRMEKWRMENECGERMDGLGWYEVVRW